MSPFPGDRDRESDGVWGELRAVQRPLSLPAELGRPGNLLHTHGVLLLERSAVPPPVCDQQHASRGCKRERMSQSCSLGIAGLLALLQVQPGLGLSEMWYSWIVSIMSVGELAGAAATSMLLRRVYTKLLMLANLALCACGGLLYGVGESGWMLLIGWYRISSSYVYNTFHISSCI